MTRRRRLIATLPILVITSLATTLLASPAGAVVDPADGTAVMIQESASNLGFFWQLTAPQVVKPGSYLLALGEKHPDSKGTRSDQQFFQISSTGSNDVPAAALAAYRHAAATMAKEQPGCQISWTLLAAIGRVESNHGRFGGAQLGSDGVSRPAIRGPQLNGAGAFAAIPDSDNGVMDGDKVWDRAVGQMQFLPSTWRSVARDGDGNGTSDPNDIDDAALGAAVYLCGAGGSLATPQGVVRAAFRYNHSDYYAQLVLSFQNGYTTGVFAVPSPPPPPTKAVAKKVKAKKAVKPAPHVAVVPTPATPVVPSKPTSKPTPKPTPTPTPTPSPQVGSFTGTLRALPNAAGYTLDLVTLDLGTDRLDNTATADYDGDGTIETNRQELDGLVAAAAPVTLHGSKLGNVLTVDKISGLAY
jgi:membrane-bound lytic murein transglycosylase B